MNDLCVSDHGDEQERALASLRLCRGCHGQLVRDLKALPGLHEDLADILAAGSTGGGSGRVSGSSSQPLPINPAVAEHRDQIKHDLVWWVLFVADQRSGLTLPADHVPALARWLGTHAEWIAATLPAAQECPPVIRGLAAGARSLLYPSGSKRIRVGPCACGGVLWATVRADDDDRPSLITCDSCDFEREPSQWLRFGREYQRERRMAG